jgi:hypothetical protein
MNMVYRQELPAEPYHYGADGTRTGRAEQIYRLDHPTLARCWHRLMHEGAALVQLAHEVNVSVAVLRDALAAFDPDLPAEQAVAEVHKALESATASGVGHKRFSDTELLTALDAFWAVRDRRFARRSRANYVTWWQEQAATGARLPSMATLLARLGGWGNIRALMDNRPRPTMEELKRHAVEALSLPRPRTQQEPPTGPARVPMSETEGWRRQILAHLAGDPSAYGEQIAAALGLSRPRFMRLMPNLRWAAPGRADSEEVLTALKACAEQVGRTPSIRDYTEWRAQFSAANRPATVETIRRAFLTWPEALEAAGLELVDYSVPKFSTQEALTFVRLWAAEASELTRADYDVWVSSRPDAPNSMWLVKRLGHGKWSTVIAELVRSSMR